MGNAVLYLPPFFGTQTTPRLPRLDSTIVLAETSSLLRSLAKVNLTEEIRQLLDDMDNKQFA